MADALNKNQIEALLVEFCFYLFYSCRNFELADPKGKRLTRAPNARILLEVSCLGLTELVQAQDSGPGRGQEFGAWQVGEQVN